MINNIISKSMKIHSFSRYRLPVLFIEYFLKRIIYAPCGSALSAVWNNYRASVINEALALPIVEKFKKDPDTFFESMAIVLREYSTHSKGILLLKYSYSFPVFLSLFNVDPILKRYHLVLEPSWTGYCEGNILCFAQLHAPVFVQSLEPKDSCSLLNVTQNMKPVDLGANWWVDHRIFKPNSAVSKDADVCVIASWSKFKNHHEIFDAIAAIRKKGRTLRAVLIGYPIDLTGNDIYQSAKERGIENQIEMYEKVGPEVVSQHLSRCKANLVWSKREGVNRAIIEGFLCDVPGILREGFNYGHRYKYINKHTGVFASPKNLERRLLEMIDGFEQYQPRNWVLNNMTCNHAAKVLENSISTDCPEADSLAKPAVSKVNYLDGMRYFNSDMKKAFTSDYTYLRSCLK